MIQNLLNSYKLFLLLSFLFLGILNPQDMKAQDDYHNTKISELFKNPKKIQWVKHYRGRVDDINDVGLMIAYDGKHCKGFITYLRSKERFKLEGNIIKGTKLLLRETDREESVTGHFEGNIEDDYATINAHWFNREKTKAGVLKLELSDREVIFPSHCGDNKWVRKYAGKVEGKEAILLLQRNSDFNIKGVLWMKERNRTYNVVGVAESDLEFKIAIKDDLNEQIAAFEGLITLPNLRISGDWINKDEEKTRTVFGKIEDITVGCIEYQDYMTTYDVTYPKSKNAAFNEYVDKTIDEWKNNCQGHVRNLKEENPNPGPDERSIASAAGWFETEHMSQKLISGYMTFNKSWEIEHEDIAFNYDLTKGKQFTLYDLFKIGVDYKTILKDKALKKLQFTSLYGSEKFREWIQNEEFGFFTIREDGIRYSTVFHPIYGRQSVTIAFSDIEEHLNPYSAVAHLFLEEPLPTEKKKKRIK